MGECVVIFLMGLFLVCESGIFGIAILPPFRMVVGVVLGRMFCRCLCCIVATTILVWWLGW